MNFHGAATRVSTTRNAVDGTAGVFVWLVVALAVGMGFAVQSRVNGELGVRLDQGVLAALISFMVGSAALCVVLVCSSRARAGVRRMIRVVRDGTMPSWYLLTGLVGAFMVATQGVVVGATGLVVYTVGIVAGQTSSGLLVDRIGFGGLEKRAVTAPRVAGAVLGLIAVGVALVGAKAVDGAWLVVLPFVAGLLDSFRQAVGGLVQKHSRSAVAQTVATFLVGTVALAVVVTVQTIAGVQAQALPTEPWLYIGGLFGIIFIGLLSVTVHHLGVLTMSLGVICGQVIASLLLDLLFPVGSGFTIWSVIGLALTIVAVSVASIRSRHGNHRSTRQ